MAVNTEIGRYYLAVLLGDVTRLRLYEGEAPLEIVDGGKRYRDAGYGDAIGLYDWLRAEDGELVGVAMTLFEEADALAHAWSHLPYVTVEEQEHYVQILFVPDNAKVYSSADQNISTSTVLVSEHGVYALVLDAIGLTDADLESVNRTTTDKSEVVSGRSRRSSRAHTG